jgi:ABC-type multidrug transport system ATPase subunit
MRNLYDKSSSASGEDKYTDKDSTDEGSRTGRWGTGTTRTAPLDRYVRSYLEKNSRQCLDAIERPEDEVLVLHEVTKLSLFYRRLPERLSNISFIVRSSSSTAILGPTRSGKSLLAGILGGQLDYDDGQIKFCGAAWERSEDKRSTDLAFTPSFICTPEELTGREFLQCIGRLRGLSEGPLARSLKEVLDAFRLARCADSPIRHYTSLLKRRLQLASCFIGRPSVAIIDEVLNPMKELPKATCLSAIKKFANDTEMAIVYFTSNPQEALGIGDQVAFLGTGTMRMVGTPAELHFMYAQTHLLHITMESLMFEEEITSFVELSFPSIVSLWVHGNVKLFCLPTESVRYSFIFDELERNKKRLHIVDWFIAYDTPEAAARRIAMQLQ